jgi:hypothetical protein
MLRIELKSIFYHGWFINLVTNKTFVGSDEFIFECYPPTIPDFCNDGLAYPTLEDALKAACSFVDREIAILTLMDVVKEWLEKGIIEEAEYWELTSFD